MLGALTKIRRTPQKWVPLAGVEVMLTVTSPLLYNSGKALKPWLQAL